jgi:hypothetical protein
VEIRKIEWQTNVLPTDTGGYWEVRDRYLNMICMNVRAENAREIVASHNKLIQRDENAAL